MSNFWSHHPTVGIISGKDPQDALLMAKLIPTQVCALVIFSVWKPGPSRFAHGWKPFKSQLRCQCSDRLLVVTSLDWLHWNQVAQSGNIYISRAERINVLSKPPPDYSDKEYT